MDREENLVALRKKTILVEPERCNGCHRCEIACSLKHFGVCSVSRARIRIHRLGEVNLPLLCLACEQAPCLDVCPVNARRILTNGAVDTVADLCIGCLACLYICPVAAPTVSPETKKTMTCDLCIEGEEPWCVKACQNQGALRFVHLTEVARRKAYDVGSLWQRLLGMGRNIL